MECLSLERAREKSGQLCICVYAVHAQIFYFRMERRKGRVGGSLQNVGKKKKTKKQNAGGLVQEVATHHQRIESFMRSGGWWGQRGCREMNEKGRRGNGIGGN